MRKVRSALPWRAARDPLACVWHQKARIHFLVLRADDATSLLEASNQISISERREQHKADADFFNAFEDDVDESDMKPDHPSA